MLLPIYLRWACVPSVQFTMWLRGSTPKLLVRNLKLSQEEVLKMSSSHQVPIAGYHYRYGGDCEETTEGGCQRPVDASVWDPQEFKTPKGAVEGPEGDEELEGQGHPASGQGERNGGDGEGGLQQEGQEATQRHFYLQQTTKGPHTHSGVKGK